mgnify:CR=1 FL=1
MSSHRQEYATAAPSGRGVTAQVAAALTNDLQGPACALHPEIAEAKAALVEAGVLGVRMSGYPNLERWAQQGVLLLNAILTVRANEAASHSRIGWTEFTDAVIRYISDNCEGVVFMLWGNFARTKRELIDSSRHHVLEAAHPSPLARGAFFGCRHFSKANAILEKEGRQPIDWQL